MADEAVVIAPSLASVLSERTDGSSYTTASKRRTKAIRVDARVDRAAIGFDIAGSRLEARALVASIGSG